MKDLSTIGRTLTNRVESLIPEMEKMSFEKLKESFTLIVTDKEGTSASSETRNKWLIAIEKKTTRVELMMLITNLYLAGCDMKSLK